MKDKISLTFSRSILLSAINFLCFLAASVNANPSPQLVLPLRIIVNSNQDGLIQPDTELTLREAIEIVNGNLPLDKLSTAEKAQIQDLPNAQGSRIEFNLPRDRTTIKLLDLLPPLNRPGLVIDGTTQPGYQALQSATAEIAIPVPIVAITPADNVEVFRGFTIMGDRITIRGLSIYGFTAKPDVTLVTPPADIFISNYLPHPDAKQYKKFNFTENKSPLQNVVVTDNWLGLPPNEKIPAVTSAFGVVVFSGTSTKITLNRIANHDGSAILTSVTAQDLQVSQNIIVGNGIAGIPDAIRLEGIINNTQITSNLICGNDGSGIFLFKPEGTVKIQENQIKFNGRRLRRAAIYLMGNDHQVNNNEISYQTGSGVVVAAYPQSIRNSILDNKFNFIEGLSIDLNTQQNVGVQDFQQGDGTNPPRNSPNRRLETGNAAINAPEFLSREFFILNHQVNIDGLAEPGAVIELYKVTAGSPNYGNLNEVIGTAETDEKGKFSFTFKNLKVGDRISAIATHPKYGTSEPASNAVIRSLERTAIPQTNSPMSAIPQCTTRPAVALSPPPEAVPPQPIQITVPQYIHFALDRDTINPASAALLDRVVKVLQQYPTLIIDLEGHTDARANDAYNQQLGLRRAIATRKYLLLQGIVPERITIRSFGERQPISAGKSKLDYARDRRVEFVFKDLRGIEILLQAQSQDLQLEIGGGKP